MRRGPICVEPTAIASATCRSKRAGRHRAVNQVEPTDHRVVGLPAPLLESRDRPGRARTRTSAWEQQVTTVLNRIDPCFGYVALAFFADLHRVRFRERKTIATTLIRKGSRLIWTGERSAAIFAAEN